MNALSPAASAVYDDINAATLPDRLDNLARTVWHRWGKGDFADDEAEFLANAIAKRQPLGRKHSMARGAVTMKPVGKLRGALGSRFAPRQHPRSPDRKASRDRRRRLGGSSALPDTLRHHYTEGQRAVLCVVAGEVKHNGVCDLPIDKIAALAGVCRTTVQTTLHEGRRLCHLKIVERPVPGRKHLTNLVEIASAEWQAWIKRGPSAHRPIGSKTSGAVKIMSTTKNTDSLKKDPGNAEAQQEAVRWAREEAPRHGNEVPPRGWPPYEGGSHVLCARIRVARHA